LPPWFGLFTLALEDKYGAKIEFVNLSEGGRCAVWGADHIAARQGALEPDLMVIAFGMNDATSGRNADEFAGAVRRIMACQKPGCEFILVGSMVANAECPFRGDYRGLARALREFADTNTAVVDVGALHEYLLTRKGYIDMTQNNVNHPNDFLARCYAMSILRLFE